MLSDRILHSVLIREINSLDIYLLKSLQVVRLWSAVEGMTSPSSVVRIVGFGCFIVHENWLIIIVCFNTYKSFWVNFIKHLFLLLI